MSRVREVGVKFQGNRLSVEVVPDAFTVKDYMQYKISSTQDTEAFWVVDLGELPKLYRQWMLTIPEVRPFYAVKVYSEPLMLSILARLGTGFDCASLSELESVLDLGVSPDRIIFAHPCKPVSHLKYAAKKGVRLMTFDSESELHKVKEHFPSARLVIRVQVEIDDSACSLGSKFGCSVPVAKHLVNRALALNLEVVGVSFHVGSGCLSAESYQSGIQSSAEIFQYATGVGCKFSVLDIGGGFPGGDDAKLFGLQAAAIRQSLAQHFNKQSFPNLNVIAEPGRYFSTTIASVAVRVMGVRTPYEGDCLQKSYYISDGLYGSLGCARFDPFMEFTPLFMKDPGSAPRHGSILWGPTLDSQDYIGERDLPDLQVGDWLYFHNIGAYSHGVATSFNGFGIPICYYYIRQSDRPSVFTEDSLDGTLPETAKSKL